MLWTLTKGMFLAIAVGAIAGGVVAGGPGAIVGIVIGFALGGVLLTFLGLCGAFSDRFPFRVFAHKFTCMHSRRDVSAVFLQNPDTGATFEVESCTLFKNPHEVTCAKKCIDDINTGKLPVPEASKQ